MAGHSHDGQEPSLFDSIGKLSTMECKFDAKLGDVRRGMHALREEYVAMQSELKGLWEEVTSLQRQNQDLTEKVQELEQKTDDLEGISKWKNLIFYGLPHRENEMY